MYFHRFRGCKDGKECYEFYRYGISTETDKFWENGQVNLKLKIDYTGHLNYHDGTWGYSDPNQFTWLSSLGYRFRHPDVHLSIGMGENLYDKEPFDPSNYQLYKDEHCEVKDLIILKKHENDQIKYDYEIIDKGTVAPNFDKTLDDIIRNIIRNTSLKSTLNT